MTLVGFTALSVEIITNLYTPYFNAMSATLRVPITLARMASEGLISIIGTCL